MKNYLKYFVVTGVGWNGHQVDFNKSIKIYSISFFLWITNCIGVGCALLGHHVVTDLNYRTYASIGYISGIAHQKISENIVFVKPIDVFDGKLTLQAYSDAAGQANGFYTSIWYEQEMKKK